IILASAIGSWMEIRSILTSFASLSRNPIYGHNGCLCVAMTTPWNIIDQLHNWASILQDHIDKLELSAERTKTLQSE
ncbi:Cytoplasmic dynein 1 light intermediate chain 2, partial [Caligus rogercresseyi]